MKRLIAYVILLSLLALLLCSCSYKQNEWYTDETLSKCLLPDFSEPTENYVKQGDNIYLNFSEEEFEKYLNGVYEYLKSKDFEYLGTRGEFHNSLSGAFASYYFKEADELSEFYVDGDYRFVYSKEGKVDENRDPIFCILKISHFESVEILEINNGRNNFKYNTVIRLRHYSEEPLGGTYVLRDNEHEHIYGEWQNDEINHWRDYICTWDTYDEDTLAEHFDNDNDGLCDVCAYEMGDNHPVKYVGFSEGHTMVALCGCCDTPDVIDPHVDSDNDTLCDLCGYKIPSYSFDELFNISDRININSISSVKLDMPKGLIGFANMSDVYITADMEYISSVIDFISNVRFIEGEGHDGVRMDTVTLFADEKSFEFGINSRNEVYVNGFCYTASESFPAMERIDESYEYINPWKDVYLSTYGETTMLADLDLSEIHLGKIEVDLHTLDYTKDTDLLVDGETIRIVSPKIIYWKGWGWYEVVSEKDFSSLIPEGETTSEITFVTEDNREIARVTLSNNQVYTTEELVDILFLLTYSYSIEIFNSDGTPFVDRAFAEDETFFVKYDPRC